MLSLYEEESSCAHRHIVLHVVRDGHIIALNTKHMGCAGPTNILSFPATEGITCLREHEALPVQPDILVLSVDTLHRECMLYGQNRVEHCVRLLAHGLGHVLGYDHGEEMFALCDAMEDVGMEYVRAEG